MIRRRLRARVFFLMPILLPVSTATSPAADKLHIRIAEQCGVDVEQPALRSYSNFNGKDGWREYKNQVIQKPEMADETPEALKPRLYLLKSALPFSGLLPK